MQGNFQVAYIGIVNNKNEPILFQNFHPTKLQELNMQLNVFCALDIVEGILAKKLSTENQQNQSISSYMGHLTSIYLGDEEFDIFGFATVTKLKIILIMKQKINMASYDDSFIKSIFGQVYKLYKYDIFNPFNNNLSDESTIKLSDKFSQKLGNLVQKFQEVIKK